MWYNIRGAGFIALASVSQPLAAFSADGTVNAFSPERAQAAFVLPAEPDEDNTGAQAVDADIDEVLGDDVSAVAESAQAEGPEIEIKEVVPVIIKKVVAPVKIVEVVAPVVINEVVAPVVIKTVTPPPAPEPVEPVQIVTVTPPPAKQAEVSEAAPAHDVTASPLAAEASGETEPEPIADVAAPEEGQDGVEVAAVQDTPAPAPETPLLTVEDLAWKKLGDTPSSDALLQFMSVYPDGVYAAEAKRKLLDVFVQEVEEVAPIPAALPAPQDAPETTETEQAALPADTPAEAEDPLSVGEAEAIIVTFDGPLTTNDVVLAGKSISELITGTALFPPVEGLPEQYWKEQQCSSCHEWKQANLCDQAKFYTSEKGAENLTKQHPYGGGFKSALRVWATSDCQ